MANFKAHCLAGGTVGIALNVTKQWSQKTSDPSREFDFGEMLVWAVLGGLLSLLPDILEPARCPNHRKFFHSLTFGMLVLLVVLYLPAAKLKQGVQGLIASMGLSYLSHLALDVITPMGLPWI